MIKIFQFFEIICCMARGTRFTSKLFAKLFVVDIFMTSFTEAFIGKFKFEYFFSVLNMTIFTSEFFVTSCYVKSRLCIMVKESAICSSENMPTFRCVAL